MLLDVRNFVRALLPAALMGVCNGCGGGGSGGTTADAQADTPPSVAVPAPVAVNRAPTITTDSGGDGGVRSGLVGVATPVTKMRPSRSMMS